MLLLLLLLHLTLIAAYYEQLDCQGCPKKT
jgi:hypothetical protein